MKKILFFCLLNISLIFSIITSKINVKTSIKHSASVPKSDCDSESKY